MVSSIVARLCDLSLENIALPSNIAYGKAIYERGAIELITISDKEIEIIVGGLAGKSLEGGGSKRRVHFWLDKDQLCWRCAGNPKGHEIFCKHCVAALFYFRNNQTV